MTTRCLRGRSPLVQFLRHASNSASARPPQRGATAAAAGQPGGGQPPQATFEPSPIFGSVKRAPRVAVPKPIPAEMKMSKPKLNTKKKSKSKPEEPKKPLTEDEK